MAPTEGRRDQPPRSAVQRTVNLFDRQEQLVQRLLAARADLTFSDVVRWAVDQALTTTNGGTLEDLAAAVPHHTYKRGPEGGANGTWRNQHRTSRWPRVKTCVGCGRRDEDVRPCCEHDDAKPLCPGCYVQGKGNHGEHGLYRREDGR